MKRLTLLRHAKSSWDDSIARDFDRPLNPRGRRAARAIGSEMRRLELRFGQVIASPAMRVVETLGEVELGFGAKLGAEYDRGVYLASAEALLERVQSAGEAVDAFLLVGHNPGLEMLALALGASSPLRTELAVKYPTATLVELTFPVERWAEVAKASGTITRLIRPRDLDPDLGPDEDS